MGKVNLNKNELLKISNISNPNLLINGDFRVNQRGQSTYNPINDYTVDGWFVYQANSNCIVTPQENGGISVDNSAGTTFATFRQYLTKYAVLANKTITISCKVKSISNNIRIYCEGTNSAIQYSNVLIVGVNTLTFTCDSSLAQVQIGLNISAGASVELEYFKLEIGSIATAYSPKPYEQELADCQVIEGGFATTYSNPNLLINGDFRVNQRGNTSYSGYVYGVDRWIGNNGSVVEPQINGGVKISRTTNGNGMLQRVENWASLVGKTITLSVKFSEIISGSARCTIYTGTTTYTGTTISISGGISTLTIIVPTNATKLECFINPIEASEVIVEYAKLEIGSVATAFTPRPYAEELALCQRYYQKIITTSAFGTVALTCSNGTNIQAYVNLIKPMRTIATFGYSGNFQCQHFGYDNQNVTNMVVDQASSNIYRLTIAIESTIVTSMGNLRANNDKNAYLEFDAEIY